MNADSRIRILPDTLVDMIAAGEVVERPASIVKELVENALDAQASYVEVQIRKGGTEEIVVADDGCGMTPDELALAVLRHATSKIRDAADLERIRTFGFRGEALPSIASVSRMTLLSRTREMDVGHGLVFDGHARGRKIVEACAPGTRITVRDLFHNVPARLKFLKSEATETAHVQDAIVHAALSAMHVHFRLLTDGRATFDFPPQPDRLRRVADVLSRRVRAGWHPLEERGPDGMRVELFLTPPEVHLSEASGVYLFVNGRPVRDRMLLSAVTGAYGGMLPRGRYPVAVLFLELPPQAVDVNVHPQKTQVRFGNERQVAAAVRGAVQRLLERAPWLASRTAKVYRLQADPAPAAAKDADPGTPAPPTARTMSDATGAESTATESPDKALDARNAVRQAVETALARFSPPRPAAQKKSAGATGSSPAPRPAQSPGSASAMKAKEKPAPGKPEPGLFDVSAGLHAAFSAPPSEPAPASAEPRYLGCHDGLYLLFELPQRLLILDMHAASERVRYEEILAQLRKRQTLSQGLLLPLEIEANGAFWEEFLPDLAALGFDAHLQDGRLVVRAVPAVLGSRPPEPVLEELHEAFLAGRTAREGTLPLQERLAATMACHSALRKNDPVTPAMAMDLYRTLQSTPSGGHCPHGRPVMLTLSTQALEALFHRR